MGKFCNTCRLTLVLLCQSVIYEPAIATNLDAVVTAIGRGQRNHEIAKSLKAMQAAAQQEISAKDQSRNQYLLATTLSVGEDNQLTIAADNVKYYENVHWSAVAKLPDCDPTCMKGIDEVQSKLRPGETLGGPTLGGGKCRNTDVHTELLFLFGAHFRNQLKSGGIFLLYSHFIPCAGLSQCSFGECAGDLAYYRHSNRERDVYFVIVYGTLFAPGGQGTGSNERLSKLYQALGGIPLLHCSKPNEESDTVCQPTNSDDEPFYIHVTNPVYQRFPRVYRNDRNQPQVYAECLSRGNFIQYLTRSNPRFEITLITDKILAEFAREYLLDQSGKVGIPYYRSLQALLARFQFKMPLEIQIVINMCSKFMLCLGDYPDGQLLLDAPLKKELEKKANTATRDDFCTTFGKALMLMRKDKPDICPKKLFN